MPESIPTVYHGCFVDDEDTRAVDAAIQDMITRFNAIPEHLIGRFAASFTLTMVGNQTDPVAAWGWLKEQVDAEIMVILAEIKGSA